MKDERRTQSYGLGLSPFRLSSISLSRSRRSLSRLRSNTHRSASTTTDTPTFTHFSTVDISLFLGRRIIYITAVYTANIAIVMFGFLKNLIPVRLRPSRFVIGLVRAQSYIKVSSNRNFLNLLPAIIALFKILSYIYRNNHQNNS